MSSEAFELAILLSLRDVASGRLDRFEDKLRATGRAGRDFLQEYEGLRKSLGRDLAIGGVGIATLGVLKRGVTVAGDFEDAVTGLRTSITELNADGSVDVARLNEEMRRLDEIGKRLGNNLPGNTQDFLELFSTLKEGGVATKEIIDGAGEAVANLAVVSKQLPKELAVPFAEFGQQFQLKGTDYVKLADLFARARSATGATPAELVEASKYFQLRAGASLGLTGFESASATTQMLAMLGRKGLKGSDAGTGLSAVFSRLVVTTPEQKKALAELRQKEHIDLQFFDKKGKFLGIENAIGQLEKLDKLSTETRTKIVKRLFEQEGMGAANILIDAGIKGYRESNDELQRKLSLQDQVNEKTATFNQKMEALGGTLDNLKVTVFEPMLPPLTTAANKANELVGNLQGFAEAHPTLTSTATYTVAIGAAALTAYSGVKVLITGWKLWRLASMVGSSEKGLLSFLAQTKTEAAATAAVVESSAAKVAAAKTVMAQPVPQPAQMQLPWAENVRGTGPVQQELPFFVAAENASKELGKSLEETTKKSTGLRAKLATPFKAAVEFAETGYKKIETSLGKLERFSSSPLVMTLRFMVAGIAIEKVLQMWEESQERQELQRTKGLEAEAAYQDVTFGEGHKQPVEIQNRVLAEKAIDELRLGDHLEHMLEPDRRHLFEGWFTFSKTYGSRWSALGRSAFFDPETASGVIRNSGSSVALNNPYVLAEVIKEIRAGAGMRLTDEGKKDFEKSFELAKPEAYKQAIGLLEAEQKRAAESFQKLNDGLSRPISELTTTFSLFAPTAQSVSRGFGDLSGPLDRLPPLFGRVGSAVSTLESRINNFHPTPIFDFTNPLGGGLNNPPPKTQGTGTFQFNSYPSKASGGIVRRTGFVQVHEREAIVPAQVTDKWRNEDEPAVLRSSRSIRYEETIATTQRRAAVAKREFNFHAPLLVIQGSAPAASDPDALAETIFARLAQEEEIAEARR